MRALEVCRTMDETHVRHRLLAILAADAAAGARRRAVDERATLAALVAARAAWREAIQRHGGRVVESVGDALLAVFETALGAIDAAAATQSAMDAAEAPDAGGERLRLRIGIHLGDVVEDDAGGVSGNGVNVATRLQGLAPAGGILVSDAVRATLGRPSARAFADEGVHEVRDLGEPVHVYRLRLAHLEDARRPVAPAHPEPAPRRPAWHRQAWAGAVLVLALAVLGALWLAARPLPRAGAPGGPRLVPLSLAVATFAAPAGAAPRAAALRRDLMAGFAAAARGITVLELPEDTLHARHDAALAGMRYVLGGSLREDADAIVVDLQIVDTSSGRVEWTQHARLRGGASTEALALARRALLGRIVQGVEAAEAKRVLALPIEGLAASELTVRAASLQARGTPAALAEADGLLERALVLEPNNVQTLVARALMRDARDAGDASADHDTALRDIDELSGHALALDARDPAAWSARALAFARLGHWNEAIGALDHALQFDPHDGGLRAERAWLAIVIGDL
jgi:class 3 adenylate cyclase